MLEPDSRLADSRLHGQVPGASVPSRLLSEVLTTATLEELERAARSERGYPLRLTDVAHDVSLPALLARWEGEVRQTRLPCFPSARHPRSTSRLWLRRNPHPQVPS